MKINTHKWSDHIVLCFEAENDAEKHQLHALNPFLIKEGADFHSGHDIALVNEEEKWTLKSISVRVRLRPMPPTPNSGLDAGQQTGDTP